MTAVGGVKCWGDNGGGPLGDGRASGRSSTKPVNVNGILGSVEADLSIEQSASAAAVPEGEPLTYSIKVTNNGPGTATAITMVDTLPTSVNFVSVTSRQANCAESEGTVTCDFGELEVGATASSTIVVIPTTVWTVTNTVRVTAVETDPLPRNNTTTEITFVIGDVVFTAVSARGSHTCALTNAGGVKCWGANRSGQLGDGTTSNREIPVDVSGLTSEVAALSAGFSHTEVRLDDGGRRQVLGEQPPRSVG